jgi:hypothetical protein
LLYEHKADIVGITESWTHVGIEDEEISFKGYSLFRKDRFTGDKVRGGFLFIYVRCSIVAFRFEDQLIAISLSYLWEISVLVTLIEREC